MTTSTKDPGCFFHGEEPIPEGAYRVCGECWHCYNTPEDLLAEDAKMAQQYGFTPVSDPEQVPFCPLCTHDW
jgi:hypothetical protein